MRETRLVETTYVMTTAAASYGHGTLEELLLSVQQALERGAMLLGIEVQQQVLPPEAEQ
jgi:hypothetical protein